MPFLFLWLITSIQGLVLASVDTRLLMTVTRSGHPVASLTHFLPIHAPSMVKAAPSPHPPPWEFPLSTLCRGISSLLFHFGAELLGVLKIFQDIDLGRKVDHGSAKGQPQEAAEVVQGCSHDVSWWEGEEGWAGDWPFLVPWVHERQLYPEAGARLWSHIGHHPLTAGAAPWDWTAPPAHSACPVPLLR